MAKSKEQYITQISPSTVIRGELILENDIRIAGRVEGTVNCSQDLILEASGVVIGDITTNSAELAGEIKGNIRTTGRLVLEGSAKVEGDISAKQIVIHDGAFFQGSCQMKSPEGGGD